MKKLLVILASCAAIASCGKISTIEVNISEKELQQSPIGFRTLGANLTKAQALNSAGHYNFGVFAYKSTENVNEIMANYLVGYMDQVGNKGYYMTSANQSTLGDASGSENGKSMWAYEKMGNAEYDYTGAEGYYTKTQTGYMSNVANQIMRYWDFSAPYTTFYAYAPYINGTGKTATFDNATKKMSIPTGSIVAGYDNPTDKEYMYAVTKVGKDDYGKDVSLMFKRLTSKVNIKFWEDIEGYSVRMIDLSPDFHGVQAAPAKRSGTPGSYTYDKEFYLCENGVTIDFSNVTAPAVAWNEGVTSQTPLQFEAPQDARVGTTRLTASASETTYYALPQSNTTTLGFTFHVSYELTSTTGERITVKNATVFVPADNISWEANKHYTYIFKITNGTNGTTGDPGTIDPTDPNVPVNPALYPIVFDNCTVEDWIEIESDHNITDDTDLVNYAVEIDHQVIATAAGGTVTAKLSNRGVDVPSPAGTWSMTSPDGATGVTFDAGTHVATIATGATTGLYTIVYTPLAGEHAPAATYSASFYVIGTYAITTSTHEIGTGGIDATAMTVSVTCSGAVHTPQSSDLSIVYPAGLTEDQKNKVHFTSLSELTVETGAVPGTYKVKFQSTEGDAEDSFVVKNYGLSLSQYEVNQNNTEHTITAYSDGGVVSLGGTYSGITVSGNTVTVATDAAAGTYTVKSTVDNNGSVTVYQRTLTVKNVYTLAVSLNKATIDNDDNEEDRKVTISASRNGVSETGTSKLKLFGPDGEISLTALTYIVPLNATPGTYTVMYYDGATVVKTASFLVQD